MAAPAIFLLFLAEFDLGRVRQGLADAVGDPGLAHVPAARHQEPGAEERAHQEVGEHLQGAGEQGQEVAHEHEHVEQPLQGHVGPDQGRGQAAAAQGEVDEHPQEAVDAQAQQEPLVPHGRVGLEDGRHLDGHHEHPESHQRDPAVQKHGEQSVHAASLFPVQCRKVAGESRQRKSWAQNNNNMYFFIL